MAMQIDGGHRMEIIELIIGFFRLLFGIRKRLTVIRCSVFVVVAGGLSAIVYFRLPADDFRPPLFIGAVFAGFLLAFLPPGLEDPNDGPMH